MEDQDDFVLEIIDVQNRLAAYIYSLVLDAELSRDILQRTNLVLVEKKADYQPGTNFFAWACRIGFFEVLTDRRDKHREKLLFDDEMLQRLALCSEKSMERFDERTEALMQCLASLPERYRELILTRYRPGGSVSVIAKALNKTPAAVSSLLNRIRNRLIECVERKLSGKAAT